MGKEVKVDLSKDIVFELVNNMINNDGLGEI